MEPLWSPVVATGGKRWQIAKPRKRRNHAKTVAAGCDQLPIGSLGKEGVSGSSPEESSAKAPQRLLDGRHRLFDAVPQQPAVDRPAGHEAEHHSDLHQEPVAGAADRRVPDQVLSERHPAESNDRRWSLYGAPW